MKAPDVGGVIDSFAELYVSYGAAEKAVSEAKRTLLSEKTANPLWEFTAVFKASASDYLIIAFYSFHGPNKEEVIGMLKFPLDTLVLSSHLLFPLLISDY